MPRPTSQMTQYLHGQLVGRDLQQMLADYAADGRFERELARKQSQGPNELEHDEAKGMTYPELHFGD